MKIIDAWWDTRNLGVKTAELEFDQNLELKNLCDFTQLSNELDDVLSQNGYVVAKVPSSSYPLLPFLQKRGFVFCEMLLNLSNNLNQNLSRGLIKSYDHISYKQVIDLKGINRVISNVQKGIFHTDRIALDPYFGKAKAGQRYAHWIQDALKIEEDMSDVSLKEISNNQLYEVMKEDCPVGFFSYKQLNRSISYPFLIGLYPNYVGQGLGTALINESLRVSIDQGCNLSQTVISSNNPAVLACHRKVGSELSSLVYVLRWHVGEN